MDHSKFSNRLFFICVFHGVLYWFLAVLFIRYFGEQFFVLKGLPLIYLFLILIPVSMVFVQVAPRLAGLSGSCSLVGVVSMCFSALILDGWVLSFFPSVYGLSSETSGLPAGWLLFWFGIILGLAVIKFRSEI